MSEEKYIEVGGRLHSIATGNVVTGANEVLDDIQNKKQQEINAELIEAVGTGGSVDERIAAEGATHYLKSETYSKSELNNMITTPNQEYINVTATDQTTDVTDVLPATGETNTVYRVGNWDGSQYDPSAYSEYTWNGSQYVHLSTKTQIGEVFDISAYRATGGTLAKYADLTAALDGGNNIPVSARKGGMSVKFVQSSDNKYIQARCMAQNFTTDVTQWQGVDDEPVAGSDNFVKSGGILSTIEDKENYYNNTLHDFVKYPGIIDSSSKWNGVNSPSDYAHILLRVKEGDVIEVTNDLDAGYYTAFLASVQTPIQGETVDITGSLKFIARQSTTQFIAPADSVCFNVPVINQGIKTQFSKVSINGYDLTKRILDYVNQLCNKVAVIPEIPLVTKLTSQISDISNTWIGSGIVKNSGIWDGVGNDNYRHSAIEVKEGDIITIRGKASTTYCAFFASIEDCLLHSTDIILLHAVPSNAEISWTTPQGAKCFEFSMLSNGTDVSPVVLKVNGADVLTSINDKLTKESIRNNSVNIDSSFDTLTRLTGIINSSSVWAAVGNDAYYHVYVPINADDTIIIDSPNVTTYGMFVKDVEIAKNGNTPNATGTLKGIVKDVKNTYVAPAETRYFVLGVKYNGTVLTYNDISVNGLSIFNSVRDDIQQLKARSGDMYDFVVDVNGNGDFTSLRECMQHIGTIIGKAASTRPDSQPEWVDTVENTNKEFNVKIMPGTYDVRSYFTNEEWTTTEYNVIGLIIPRGVNLIGMGKKRSDVVITCTSETIDNRKSTMNIQNDVTIANLTIKGNNVRYVVHDDYSYYPYSNKYGDVRVVKDVDFIGENLLYGNIWGAGTKGGANWKFENCTFVNKDSSCGFAVHDRNGNDQTAAEQFILENCNFFGKYVEGRGNLIFSPLTGGCDENVILIGCVFNAIQIDTSVVSGVTPITIYNIKGNGNSKDYEVYTESDFGKLSIPKFADECIPGYNIDSADIYIGDYVINVNGQFTKGTSSNYSGIALEDIPIGESGLIKINS